MEFLDNGDFGVRGLVWRIFFFLLIFILLGVDFEHGDVCIFLSFGIIFSFFFVPLELWEFSSTFSLKHLETIVMHEVNWDLLSEEELFDVCLADGWKVPELL